MTRVFPPKYSPTIAPMNASVEATFKAVKKMAGNTKYEEVTCIGLNPAQDLLEATVQIA